ncbi:MAG: hypothetical protein K0R33_4657, partial [Mycobacterium sp.]|nr:hypothetical protein [Mycobacterium sp.]
VFAKVMDSNMVCEECKANLRG